EKDSSVFVDLLAKTSQEAAAQSEGGIVGQGGVGSIFGWSAYANSLGVGAADRSTIAYIYIVLLAPTPTGMTPGIVEIDVKRSFELEVDRVIADAVKYLQVAKKPAEGETGPQTVVFTGDAIGTLLFFALLPSIRGDGIVRQKSILADKLGETVASETLSFLDDGLRPGAWATSLFDAEGVPRRSTPIIEKGKLKSFIWDTYWANRHGVESTGNASRNLRTGVISIQPSTLVVPQGKGSLEDLISDISSGYLVSGLQGAHSSNQDTGDFSVVANPCFRIIDGELTGCVNGQMVAGCAFDLLQKVDKLAGDSRQFLLPGGTAIHGPSISFSGVQAVAKES
ncbi:MAG: metallopeptidase TldD-related protein, partial [Promethearchaeota archaeon]